MKRFIIPLIILVFLLTGCKADFTDSVSQIKVSKIALPDIEHAYGATWITDKTIFIIKDLYREDFDHDYLVNPNSNVIMDELYSYNIDGQDWTKMPITPENCHAGNIGGLSRLPNGKVGLVYSCLDDNKAIIREFDISMKNGNALFENKVHPNEEIGVVGPYTFSADMSEFVQEDATGNYLDNQLYYIVRGKTPKQIVPDFIRAQMPAWSSQDREIAFWGVPDYHGDKRPTEPTWQDLLFLPTNLYLSSPEGNNVKVILSSIEDPSGIEWSPTKNLIAFACKFKGVEGLWLIDPTTLEVTRIWNKRVGFSWSPDGKEIVISDAHYDFGKYKNASIRIIQLP